MKTFIAVVLIALLFSAVYLLIHAVGVDKPRCPECGRRMRYMGEDENGRETWVCTECGETLLY